MKDKLNQIFELQEQLRIKIGNGKDRFTNCTERELGQMVSDLMTAIIQEACEAQNDILWKWWADKGDRYKFKDKEALIIELVDILFFLLDGFAAMKVSPDRVFDIYKAKWKVNMDRQDKNYSAITKTEEDNNKIEDRIKKGKL